MAEKKNSALIAKCRDKACGYAWIIAFLPMDVSTIGWLGKTCTCPMCGDTKPSLGRPSDLHPTLDAHLQALLTKEPEQA
jgi:hypothetical protein